MKFQITLDINGARDAAEYLRRHVERFLNEKVTNLTVEIVKNKIIATFTLAVDRSLDLVGRLKDHLGFPYVPAVSKLST